MLSLGGHGTRRVASEGEVEVCLKHPGHPVDVTVSARLRPLASVWLGQQEPRSAVRSGVIQLEGKPALIRNFDRWCPRSRFSGARTLAGRGSRRSGAPWPTARAAHEENLSHLKEAQAAARALDLRLVALGYRPYGAPSDLSPGRARKRMTE